MKIVQFTQPGPPEVLKYIDAPEPEPKAGEVLVRAHSIGVGIPDTRIRAGTYPWMPSLPCIPGTEMGGVIEKIGPGVTSRNVGDRVMVSARERSERGGCYAEFITTPADGTYVLPAHVSFDAAASLANYQVAYHLLRDGARARPGDRMLTYGAAGGMGNALIDLARAEGIEVIGVVSSASKGEFAKELGAAHVINRKTENITERVATITGGRGVDIVIDPVGGPLFADNLVLIGSMGIIINYGGLAGRAEGDLLAAMRRHQIKCPAVRTFTIHTFDHRPDERRAGMRALIDMLAAGTICPRIHWHLHLSNAKTAHEMIERGEVIGKLILTP
jgi:NADPH:quinone reductase